MFKLPFVIDVIDVIDVLKTFPRDLEVNASREEIFSRSHKKKYHGTLPMYHGT